MSRGGPSLGTSCPLTSAVVDWHETNSMGRRRKRKEKMLCVDDKLYLVLVNPQGLIPADPRPGCLCLICASILPPNSALCPAGLQLQPPCGETQGRQGCPCKLEGSWWQISLQSAKPAMGTILWAHRCGVSRSLVWCLSAWEEMRGFLWN